MWATGFNQYGQLGDRSTTSTDVFVKVISDEVKAVATGAYHSMVLKKDGSVWATGSNEYGQFGDGSTASRQTFGRVEPFTNGTENDAVEHNCTALR